MRPVLNPDADGLISTQRPGCEKEAIPLNFQHCGPGTKAARVARQKERQRRSKLRKDEGVKGHIIGSSRQSRPKRKNDCMIQEFQGKPKNNAKSKQNSTCVTSPDASVRGLEDVVAWLRHSERREATAQARAPIMEANGIDNGHLVLLEDLEDLCRSLLLLLLLFLLDDPGV